MEIRTGKLSDLDALSAVENECFPPAEAASREAIESRLKVYSSHFWLLLDDQKLVSFVDGMVTDIPTLTDDQAKQMLGKWSTHEEHSAK